MRMIRSPDPAFVLIFSRCAQDVRDLLLPAPSERPPDRHAGGLHGRHEAVSILLARVGRYGCCTIFAASPCDSVIFSCAPGIFSACITVLHF
jgi:hypothetical protein